MDTPGQIDWMNGKPMLSLIPLKGQELEARALMFGMTKHGKDSWRSLTDKQLFLDAALRHLMKYANGDKIDDESGLSHLGHCRANLNFLAEMEE